MKKADRIALRRRRHQENRTVKIRRVIARLEGRRFVSPKPTSFIGTDFAVSGSGIYSGHRVRLTPAGLFSIEEISF